MTMAMEDAYFGDRARLLTNCFRPIARAQRAHLYAIQVVPTDSWRQGLSIDTSITRNGCARGAQDAVEVSHITIG